MARMEWKLPVFPWLNASLPSKTYVDKYCWTMEDVVTIVVAYGLTTPR